MTSNQPTDSFASIVENIPAIGVDWYSEQLIERAKANLRWTLDGKTTKELEALPEEKRKSSIIISAGPSVRRNEIVRRVKEFGYKGTLVVADGAYVNCLREGLFPDFVLSLDPHNKRLVRWFGDPNFEKNSEEDDYFERQDLDVSFRQDRIKRNQEDIELVNKHAFKTKAIICASVDRTVSDRVNEAGFDCYYWNPLVDNPRDPESLTRKLYSINRLPCFNTGGTVGTAAWVFAAEVLGIKNIAVTGMDFGYYKDNPYEMTQTYYELLEKLGDDKDKINDCFLHMKFPMTEEEFYTDPTYYWYRKNFLEMIKTTNNTVYNCSEAGILFGDNVVCEKLETFMERNQ